MDDRQILERLKNELDEKTKYESYVKFAHCWIKDNLNVFSHNMHLSSLTFCIANNLLVLIKEYYQLDVDPFGVSCNIVVGEPNIDNIINIVNIFVEHGRANNKNNPSMKKLLNDDNRFAKTKSARNTE